MGQRNTNCCNSKLKICRPCMNKAVSGRVTRPSSSSCCRGDRVIRGFNPFAEHLFGEPGIASHVASCVSILLCVLLYANSHVWNHCNFGPWLLAFAPSFLRVTSAMHDSKLRYMRNWTVAATSLADSIRCPEAWTDVRFSHDARYICQQNSMIRRNSTSALLGWHVKHATSSGLALSSKHSWNECC